MAKEYYKDQYGSIIVDAQGNPIQKLSEFEKNRVRVGFVRGAVTVAAICLAIFGLSKCSGENEEKAAKEATKQELCEEKAAHARTAAERDAYAAERNAYKAAAEECEKGTIYFEKLVYDLNEQLKDCVLGTRKKTTYKSTSTQKCPDVNIYINGSLQGQPQNQTPVTTSEKTSYPEPILLNSSEERRQR